MQSIYPVLIYKDCPAAIEFLERAVGLERHALHEGRTAPWRMVSCGWATS